MPATQTPSALNVTASTVTAWTDPLHLEKPVDYLVEMAAAAARAFRRDGIANICLEPGNSTRYLMTFTYVDHTCFPGDLLVSLPEFNKSVLLALHGFHVPTYIDEKLGMTASSTAVLAAFLSLFSAAYTDDDA